MKEVYDYDSGDSQDCVKLSEPAVAYADTYMPCIFTADELEEELLVRKRVVSLPNKKFNPFLLSGDAGLVNKTS